MTEVEWPTAGSLIVCRSAIDASIIEFGIVKDQGYVIADEITPIECPAFFARSPAQWVRLGNLVRVLVK